MPFSCGAKAQGKRCAPAARWDWSGCGTMEGSNNAEASNE